MLGYGNKAINSMAERLNAKYNPSPDSYNMPEFCK